MRAFQCPIHIAVLTGEKDSVYKRFNIHREAGAMALAAQRIKNDNGKSFVQIPFCTTVIAEAFGATVNYGEGSEIPRIKRPHFQTVLEVLRSNLNDKRKNEMIQAVKILADKGEKVVLNVEGPLTVLTSLVESVHVFKTQRKKSAEIEDFIEVYIQFLFDYVGEALKSGVALISYADPLADATVLGPESFNCFWGPVNVRVLKRLEAMKQPPLIHVCGKLSLGLESRGLMAFSKLDSPWPQQGVYGHGCLNAK